MCIFGHLHQVLGTIRQSVRLDTTHGQPRAHRGDLTELGIRLRRSWGEMAKRTGRCVSLSLRDGVRAN